MQKIFEEMKNEVETRVRLKKAQIEILVPATLSIELANQMEIPVNNEFSLIADIKKVQTVDEYDTELGLNRMKKVTLELRGFTVNSHFFNIWTLGHEKELTVITA